MLIFGLLWSEQQMLLFCVPKCLIMKATGGHTFLCESHMDN